MEISIGYRLDAESIGRQIYGATGFTAPELLELVRSENEKV